MHKKFVAIRVLRITKITIMRDLQTASPSGVMPKYVVEKCRGI
jgi:hypothetical protein